VPLYLVAWPDQKNEGNLVHAFPVPSFLSLLATYTTGGEVKGLKDYAPQDRPPVLPVFLSFRAMVGLAFLFLGLGAWAWWVRKRPLDHPLLLRILPWAIVLPYLANEVGWTIAELGRQPWIVYGIMRTSDAVSVVPAGQVMATLVGFVLLYSLLGAVDFYLLFKYARKGPAPAGRG
jgi:cytochrome bd ubiquinol oxidase subunit I